MTFMLRNFLLLICLVVFFSGSANAQNPDWYAQHGWVEEDYFQNPKTISLCGAIRAGDVGAVRACITNDANVNDVGKNGMTPLLWAIPDNRENIFALLLESGADPNVYITGSVGAPDYLLPGETVTHCSCRLSGRHFYRVFENGGDPNLVSKCVIRRKGETPIFAVVDSRIDVLRRLEVLKTKGADFGYKLPVDSYAGTVAMLACQKKDYSECLFALNNGTDFDAYDRTWSRKVITILAKEARDPNRLPVNEEARLKLIHWLEDHGESLQEAIGSLVEIEQATDGKSAKDAASIRQDFAAQNRLAYYKKRGIDVSTLPLGVGYWYERHPIAMNPRNAPRLQDFPYAEKQWHADRLGFDLAEDWKPESFFEDQQVVELCNAIQDVDLPKMRHLVEAGVNVNAMGKGGMNPLFYAYHVVHNSDPFELLLDFGADPNLLVDLRAKPFDAKRSRLSEGFVEISVTHLVTRSGYNRLFKKLYESAGAAPNLGAKTRKEHLETPFQQLNQDGFAFPSRLQLLIDKGADLDVCFGDGSTMLTRWCAIHGMKNFSGAYTMLEAGADYRMTFRAKKLRRGGSNYEGCYFRLIHYLAETESSLRERNRTSELESLEKVVNWLEAHDESLLKAKEDLARWKKWLENDRLDLIEEEHRNSK